MRGTSGLDATRELTATHPRARILVHTASTAGGTIDQAARAGAAGCLFKGGAATDLITAIRTDRGCWRSRPWPSRPARPVHPAPARGPRERRARHPPPHHDAPGGSHPWPRPADRVTRGTQRERWRYPGRPAEPAVALDRAGWDRPRDRANTDGRPRAGELAARHSRAGVRRLCASENWFQRPVAGRPDRGQAPALGARRNSASSPIRDGRHHPIGPELGAECRQTTLERAACRGPGGRTGPHSAASRINDRAVASEGSSTTTPAGSISGRSVAMSPLHGPGRGWRLAVAAAAAVAAAGALPSVASSATPTAPTRNANPAACAHRVNNTPRKLVDCVNKADLWAHMVKFQQIADANPGADGHPSRNSGEPGYRASADYVASVMRAAGYAVTCRSTSSTTSASSVTRCCGRTRRRRSRSGSARSSTLHGWSVRRRRSSNPRAASSCPPLPRRARPAAARPPTSPGSGQATSP